MVNLGPTANDWRKTVPDAAARLFEVRYSRPGAASSCITVKAHTIVARDGFLEFDRMFDGYSWPVAMIPVDLMPVVKMLPDEPRDAVPGGVV